MISLGMIGLLPALIWGSKTASANTPCPPEIDPQKRNECLLYDGTISLGASEYAHLLGVEETTTNYQALKDAKLEAEVLRTRTTLQLFEGDTPLVNDPAQASKEIFFSYARKLNDQIDNDVVVKAATLGINIYYTTREKDPEWYLTESLQMIDAALANKRQSPNYDTDKFMGEKDVATIWEEHNLLFCEAYFELSVAKLQILLITNPPEALHLAEQLLAESLDERFVWAQGYTLVSAHGYVSRVNLLKINREVHQQEADLDSALKTVEEIQSWILEQEANGIIFQLRHGFSNKDLKHDELLAINLRGKILLQMGKYNKAAQAFQEVLAQPEAMRLYGGFMDQGIDAYLHLAFIALKTSATREEAGNKLDQYYPWAAIDANDDLRTALGFAIKEKRTDFHQQYTDTFNQEPIETKDLIGSWALWLDLSPHTLSVYGKITRFFGLNSLSLQENTPIKSEVKVSTLPTGQDKMSMLLRCLQIAEIDPTFYEVLRQTWLAKGIGEQ